MATAKRRTSITLAFVVAGAGVLLNPSRASAQNVTTTEFGCPANATPQILEACRIDADTYENRFLKGDYDGAIAGFGEAIRLDPDDPVLYLNRANSYSQRGFKNKNPNDYKLAIIDYQTGLKKDSNNFHLYNGLGITYQRQRNLPAALESFNSARQIDPRSSLVHFNLGNLYWEMADADKANASNYYQDAIEEFSAAIRFSNDAGGKADAYFEIGQICELQAKDPQNPPGYTQIKLDEAENNYRSALGENPSLTGAQNGIDRIENKITGGNLSRRLQRISPPIPSLTQP